MNHGANAQVRRDWLLHPRSWRLYYPSRTEHRAQLMSLPCAARDTELVPGGGLEPPQPLRVCGF